MHQKTFFLVQKYRMDKATYSDFFIPHDEKHFN